MAKRSQAARTTVIGRDLERIHRFALHLLAENGRSDYTVCWEETLETEEGGGVTRAHGKRIVFSAAHLAILGSDDRRDVVRHEVAHAIVGAGDGHSAAWQAMAAQLGGTGTGSIDVDARKYPWFGWCPDGHGFASIMPAGPGGFICANTAHDEPVRIEEVTRNAKSPAFDPGIKKMAVTYPEPAFAPTFTVGETLYVVPYGSATHDNAQGTVTAVTKRSYTVELLATGEEIDLAFEGASAHPV